jgi:RNA polymerase sigma factor (sigma-70 family)
MVAMTEITAELVARATAGDGSAVTEIVRALERPFYNMALRMLSYRQDAEDAAQEALIRVVTHLAQYRGDAAFSTWAWRIAIRQILDARTTRPRYSFDEYAADLADGREDSAAERPENAVLYRELKVICSRALLQCLDADQRVAFVLGDILELDSTDAAEIVEVDPATFRKRLSRARAALSGFLMRHCGVVNEAAPCACHRRLTRATALGRLDRDVLDVSEGNLVQLRRKIAALPDAERVGASYRSDPELTSRRDIVTAVHAMLDRLPLN